MGIFVSSWLGILYVYSVVLVLFIEAKMTLEDQGRMGVSFSITKVKIDKNGLIFYMPVLANFDVQTQVKHLCQFSQRKFQASSHMISKLEDSNCLKIGPQKTDFLVSCDAKTVSLPY